MTDREKKIRILLQKMRSLPFGPERLEVFDQITALRGEEIKEAMEQGRMDVQSYADSRPGGRQGPASKVGWKKTSNQ